MTTDGRTPPDSIVGGAAPDVVRAAYVELHVTDLAASRRFYVDILGLHVSYEDSETICLRSLEEFIHHNLVLRRGPVPATAAIAYRVRTPEDVDRAERWFRDRDCPTERRPDGFVPGVGDAVRVVDPMGFVVEFFHTVDHVERLTMRYDLCRPGELVRFDHVNLATPDIDGGARLLTDLGFRVTEDIRDDDGRVYAVWLRRKNTVHDTALTCADGPRLHHMAFCTRDAAGILALCDRLGALRRSDAIERGPGRHGVSNAFYVYLFDPDGHRVEAYTQDYYTGDPDNPVVHWDVHDNQRRDWWGNPVVESWYRDASPVLDLAGVLAELRPMIVASESTVTVGADGFTVDRAAAGKPATNGAAGAQVRAHDSEE